MEVIVENIKFKRMLRINILLVGLMFIIVLNNNGQAPAFPGAEGYGAYTTGGRGGEVYIVSNLDDDGPGSLREAIKATGARTIVFSVSGTIELKTRLDIKNGDVTIAGQTAPGDGICLKNAPITVTSVNETSYSAAGFVIDADNVIIRFIRFRPGDDVINDLGATREAIDFEHDALFVRYRDKIIIDHCSTSWSIDEALSAYFNTNFTLQWCIVSESLFKSYHPKGDHGYGGIWGGQGATFHHNLLAHHTSRNPRFCGSRYSDRPDLEKVDHRNNVIFNWSGNSAYGAEGGSYNIINNYYLGGPSTTSNKTQIIKADLDNGGNAQPAGVHGFFYVNGNYMSTSTQVTSNNWDGVNCNLPDDSIRVDTEYDFPVVTTHTAEEAYERVLAYSGAILPNRDAVDTRIANEVRTGKPTYTGSLCGRVGIIDKVSDVGGWPVLNSTEAPTDTDKDGIPDDWEDANGLNKNLKSDGAVITASGYSNLENYINSLVDDFDYIILPRKLQATVNLAEVDLSWTDMADNETGFVIERSNGTGFIVIDTADANTSAYTDNTIPVKGTYKYRVMAINDKSKSFYTDSVSATITVTNIFENVASVTNLQVGPNPFSSELMIKFNTLIDEHYTLALYDLAGKMALLIENKNLQAGEHVYHVDANKLNNGLYFLKIMNNEDQKTIKVILEK